MISGYNLEVSFSLVYGACIVTTVVMGAGQLTGHFIHSVSDVYSVTVCSY